MCALLLIIIQYCKVTWKYCTMLCCSILLHCVSFLFIYLLQSHMQLILKVLKFKIFKTLKWFKVVCMSLVSINFRLTSQISKYSMGTEKRIVKLEPLFD
jgi:hypothetical protein